MKRKLHKVFLLSVLGFGAAFGMPMDPQKIEELLDVMNRPKAEVTIPDYDDSGDGKLRRRTSKGEEPLSLSDEPLKNGSSVSGLRMHAKEFE